MKTVAERSKRIANKVTRKAVMGIVTLITLFGSAAAATPTPTPSTGSTGTTGTYDPIAMASSFVGLIVDLAFYLGLGILAVAGIGFGIARMQHDPSGEANAMKWMQGAFIVICLRGIIYLITGVLV